MSQISPPIRILLVASIAVLAAWMLFLRPKSEATPAPPASSSAPNVQTGEPAVSAPGKAAQAAQNAADATNAQMQTEATNAGADADAAPAAAAKPGTATRSAPAETAPAAGVDAKLTGLPLPVMKAIAHHKVLVLLFYNNKSADDRAVRTAIRGVDRWDGRVFVKSAPIKSISAYGRITRGVDVQQSPTVVVVDRKLRADRLVGYVDTETIDQAVVDALRNSGGLLTDRYLRSVNSLCASTGRLSFAVADPNSAGEVPGFLASQRRIARRMDARFHALRAPARWRGFKRATAADHAALLAMLADWSAALGSSPSARRVVTSVARFGPRFERLGKRYDRRMDRQHVLSCGSDA